jgi:hypothetical protein
MFAALAFVSRWLPFGLAFFSRFLARAVADFCAFPPPILIQTYNFQVVLYVKNMRSKRPRQKQ